MTILKRGPWHLSDLELIPKNGKKVFSSFSCGGGSTMGYKLAGFDVIGCCEIDPKMFHIYRANHDPKFAYNMPIEKLVNMMGLPQELYKLDILDGSPPCSSFSYAGLRHRNWGDEKIFREGQAKQVLDDLFFDFIDLVVRLRPKVVIAENVKGLVQGKARGYVRMILDQFARAEYDTQLFVLNAASMGVPQKRERSFLIARRKDLELPKISLNFNEAAMPLNTALTNTKPDGRPLAPSLRADWKRLKNGEAKKYQSSSLSSPSLPAPTITSKITSAEGSLFHWESPRKFSVSETIRISTFPEDFNFLDSDPGYVMGMSVPPFMMQRIAHQIDTQVLPTK